MDTSYQPDVDLASSLWIHEGLGHGVGLSHTRGGVMNPSIIRSPLSWRGDPSERAMTRLYGGVPYKPDDDDDDDDDDNDVPPDLVRSGGVMVDRNWYEIWLKKQ